MRRLVAMLLCFALAFSAAAQAAGFEPRQFLELYGLIFTGEAAADGSDFTWCALEGGKNSDTLALCDGAAVVRFVDDPAMNGPSADVSNIRMTFVEFCGAFDFDAFAMDCDAGRIAYSRDTPALQKLFEVMPDYCPDEVYHDRGEFIDAANGALNAGSVGFDADGYFADTEAAGAIARKIVEAVNTLEQRGMLYGARLDRVEVNPNSGTAAAGDFIGLVYLIYDGRGIPADDCQNIVQAATDIAARVEVGYPEIVGLCAFIDLPAYDLNAKVQFERDGNHLRYSNVVVPIVPAGTEIRR